MSRSVRTPLTAKATGPRSVGRAESQRPDVALAEPSTVGDILRQPLQQQVGSASTVATAAVSGAKDVKEAVPVEATDTSSITTAVGGFLYALQGLYEAMTEGQPREKVRAVYAQVVKSGGVIRGSIAAAEHAGAGIASTVVPGVGLAWSCLEILADVATLAETYNAIDANRECIAAAEPGSTESLAYDRVAGDLDRRLRNSMMQIAGDILKITGGVLQLAVGPVGTIVAIAGVLVKLAGSAATFASKRRANKGRATAHAEQDQATMSGDSERIDGAKRQLITADSVAAIREIVAKATTVDDDATALDPRMERLLGGFGVGDELMGRLFGVAKLPPDNGDRRAVLAIAERQVQIFLGASGFDPRSSLEKLGDALDAVGAWFREKLGITTSDPHAEVSDHYVANSAQFAVQPIVGDYFGTPKDWEGEEPSSTELTARIASEHRKLMKIYVAAADEPKRVARAKALDLGIRLAVEQEVLGQHLSVPLQDMVVSSGSVYFPAADLSTKIGAATRLAVGRKIGDCLTRSYVRRPSPDVLAAELTGVVSAAMGPLRERYLATVRARNDRKTLRERVAVMDAAVAHMIRRWAKHAAKFHEVPVTTILPGEVTVNGGVVAITDAAPEPAVATGPELAAA